MSAKPVILVGERWRRLVEVFLQELIVNERDLALLTLVNTVEGAVAALDETSEQRGEWYG